MVDSTKMVLVSYILLVVIALNANQVRAFTEEENFAYVDKILTLLNDNKECRLPTYEEIDELQASFEELEAIYGLSLDKKLTCDQKLVRQTVLYRWESFQRYMTSAVVIRSAKRRSFLNKVEEYQREKFGKSICSLFVMTPVAVADRIFEKNPLVRYLKHIRTHEVLDGSAEDEKARADQSIAEDTEQVEAPSEPIADVVYTPISESEVPPNEEDQVGAGEGPVETKVVEDSLLPPLPPQAKEGNFYDPLTDVPVPQIEEPNQPEELGKPTSPEDSEESSLQEEPSPDQEPEEPDMPKESEKSVPSTEHKESEQPEKLEEPVLPEEPIEREKFRLTPKPFGPPPPGPGSEFDKYGDENANDLSDYLDLNRLDRVEPVVWEFNINQSYFSWPDEKPFHHSGVNTSIKAEWIKFLNEPFEIQEEEKVPKQSLEAVDELQPKKPIQLGGLRKRKKDFYKSIRDDLRQNEREGLFGWDNCKDSPVLQPDCWKNVVNNKYLRLRYNQDYIKNLHVKSMFGSQKVQDTKKRRLLNVAF